MSDESPRRSFESFRKEAKQWLRAIREGFPEARARMQRVIDPLPAVPTLRDVQHALALENGFSGWTALKQHSERHAATLSELVREYDVKVEALLDAYRTGTPEAIQRHWSHTWHRRAWQGMRTYVQIGLGFQASPDIEITTDDARYLIAREHGFESWDALVQDLANPVAEDALVKRMSVFSTRAPKEDDPRFDSRYWSEIIGALSDSNATGIEAHGQMTDELLEQVSANSHLTMLRCGGSAGVTDDGLRFLARMPNLTHLDLSGTAITDRGLAVLAELRQLERISLSWTRISDAGVASLAGCDLLQHVDISGTVCGDASLRTFAGKPHLSHFKSGERTTDDGLPVLLDYPVFRAWQGAAEKDFVLWYDSSPNQLFLRGRLTKRGFEHIAKLEGLFGLNVDDAAMALPGEVLEPLARLPHLGWLAFDAHDDAMPHIARMPNLRGLGCQDSPATDHGWVALGASRSLERIWARRCYGLSNNGFRALSRMPSLQSWSGSCRNVDDDALGIFPDFPKLSELVPMDVPDEGYRHIAKCKHIRKLTLMYCRDTTDLATEHVATMNKLTSYFASYTQITDRTPELLSRVSSLEQITFDGCAGLTNSGVATLARLPNLQKLSVSGRGISASVRAAFPERVKVHYSL